MLTENTLLLKSHAAASSKRHPVKLVKTAMSNAAKRGYSLFGAAFHFS
ncbi:hypothetical protein KHS38_20545 [Mucilaginibacter sp. Bleaf8]|nr:hypothetical protein [Mucilaginibacter sp. Bleaf8]MBS7566807.1 hypothetical protein [Mucilaginibacter sp. Bleaf8]